VTTALAQTERRQRQLNRRLLYMGIAGLVVTALGTWLAAGGVLSPLRRLRRATAQIAADEDLSHTVPQKGPREIKSVATSFNAMLARLSRSAADRERALAATRRFAADAGHELRTPLTAVQATLSSLARHPELDAERRTAMATDAMSEQRRLVDLLDGLQALARGAAAPGADGDVDLGEVVADVVAREGAGEVSEVDLPEAPVLVRGWDAGLRVLTGNLIRNAVVHGGHVKVALADGATPKLTVDDDGPGIPQEDRARIFEPFTRLDGGERPGSGLGLALVAQQARHHGADVEVSQSPLGGARFVVTFPGRAE
jgi:signal transduction histidine kinase